MSLEEKLTRLQEIQKILSEQKVNLSQSMPLLEEAFQLKEEIEKELKLMENKLVELTKTTDNS
jgi:exonuclease VII small subunit